MSRIENVILNLDTSEINDKNGNFIGEKYQKNNNG